MDDNPLVLQIIWQPRHSQKPTLTLALSRRERELTVVDVRGTPTCNTESYANFKANQNRPLSRGRGLG
jgi:hypothetical protein